MPSAASGRPSLEALVESGLLQLESLHPGGLEMARQLAELCRVDAGTKVLDVAAGTGETACLLAERFRSEVLAVDASEEMIRRGRDKARARGLNISFQQADATRLPFDDATFDVAICECTLCLLDKQQVLREMVRVLRPGGRLGMHDLCWQEGVPEHLKQTLADIEGEEPETLAGWERLLAEAHLDDIHSLDKSDAKADWMRDSRRQLGWRGQLAMARYIIGRWGVRGLFTVLRSRRVFANPQLGYGILVGTKR